MPAPGKMKRLARKFDKPMYEVVCELLNEHKTIKEAARVLDISESNLFRYIEKNHIRKNVRVEWICDNPIQS